MLRIRQKDPDFSLDYTMSVSGLLDNNDLGMVDILISLVSGHMTAASSEAGRICRKGDLSAPPSLWGCRILPEQFTAQNINHDCFKEGIRMSEYRIKVAPNTVAYADAENHKLVVEFAIPGAPTDTIEVKILEDSIHLTAPARDIEYVSALALGWPVKPDKAEATYEHGLLRVEVPFKDPMEDAVKIAIKAGGADIKTK